MFSMNYTTDKASMAALATPYLMTHEDQHNVLLGVLNTITHYPDTYPEAHLMIAHDAAGAVVGLTLQTPPHPISISIFSDLAALQPLAEAWLPLQAQVQQFNGRLNEAQALADHWQALTGQPYQKSMDQLLYRLDSVVMPHAVPGQMRHATTADFDLLVAWLDAFDGDIFGADRPSRPDPAVGVQRFLMTKGRGLVLWVVDGVPVSMAGYGAMTSNGVRISAVYTPDAQRGKGYAKAVTAACSHYLLTEQGRKFCVLYTDTANPASNAAYRSIGYVPIQSAAMMNVG